MNKWIFALVGAMASFASPWALGQATCGTATLSQSTSLTITALNSVSCNNGIAHTNNAYFRVFPSASLPDGFQSCAVRVGVESATGNGGTQPVTVRIHRHSGAAFPAGTLTEVGSVPTNVADQALTVISVPLSATVPAGDDLVVEVFTPNGQTAGNNFFIGSNAAGQSAPSYIQAADCGVTAPTTLAGISFPNMHTVLLVDGVQGVAADLAITKTDGVNAVAAGGSVTYTIAASNAGPGDVTAATVADNFPASLSCTWTCVGADGGTCTASGSGNINDVVNLPSGASTTYTAACSIAASVTGTLSNTATVSAPDGVTDPDLTNNTATDTDNITPVARTVAPVPTLGEWSLMLLSLLAAGLGMRRFGRP